MEGLDITRPKPPVTPVLKEKVIKSPERWIGLKGGGGGAPQSRLLHIPLAKSGSQVFYLAQEKSFISQII